MTAEEDKKTLEAAGMDRMPVGIRTPEERTRLKATLLYQMSRKPGSTARVLTKLLVRQRKDKETYKMFSGYVQGVLDALEENGRVRSKFKPPGAAGGRPTTEYWILGKKVTLEDVYSSRGVLDSLPDGNEEYLDYLKRTISNTLRFSAYRLDGMSRQQIEDYLAPSAASRDLEEVRYLELVDQAIAELMMDGYLTNYRMEQVKYLWAKEYISPGREPREHI